MATAVLLTAVAGAGGGVAPALAQPVTCPSTGPDTGQVSLAEPAPGAAVSGRVTVRGSASSPVDVARVELFVGDARRDFAVFDPPTRSGTFVLGWDSAGAPPGPATLRVVACGGGQGTVPLSRGIGSVAVDVRASSPRPVPAPLTPVTSEDPDAPGDRGPLWVGLAVGVAGLAGLMMAAGYRPGRPRTRATPVDAPPVAPPG